MRILVVEDERRVASFICRALRENAYAVDVAYTGEHALEIAGQIPYDCVLLDIRLPGLNGIQVCRKLRQSRIDVSILMLTGCNLIEQRVEGLDAGADDYLTKPFAIAELLARVRSLVRRQTNSGPVLHYAGIGLERRQRQVTYADQCVPLTAKEFAILEFLLLRAPETATRTEIIEHVWDSHFESGTNLVEVYINRLRQKISRAGRTGFIHTVHGIGYCLKNDQ